jgi:CheY-like chemotaxis protein
MNSEAASILVADGNQNGLRLVSAWLRGQGYWVTTTSDGLSAVDTVLKDYPDLVVCDILLAGVNGFDVCFRLKSDPKTRDIPVILTALDPTDLVGARPWAVASDIFLNKPLLQNDFLRFVQRCL